MLICFLYDCYKIMMILRFSFHRSQRICTEKGKCQGGVKDIQLASPQPDECQFFTDPTVLDQSSGSDSDQFQCLILQSAPQESDIAEIRPLLVETELGSGLPREPWPRNLTHKTIRLTYILPPSRLANLGVRRITIGGGFFGQDTSGHLDAEACD